MQTWLVYSIIAGSLATAYQYLNRRALKDAQDATAYAWWFETLRVGLFLLILPFNYSLNLTSPQDALILILPGFIEIISVYAFMKMFAFTQLSVSTLISSLRFIFTPLLATLFLGEILTPTQYGGIFLIFLGAIISTQINKIRSDPGIRYSLLFAVLVGLLSVSVKAASDLASTSITMLAMSLPPIFILPLFMKNPLDRIKQSARARLKPNAMATVFNVIAMLLFVEAIRSASTGLVFSVFNAMGFLSILVGIVFLHETDLLSRKLLGTVAYLAGIFLLA